MAETERMLVRAAVLYRLFGLTQIALTVALDVARYPYPIPTLGLAAAVSIESAALAWAIMRRRRFVSWMIGADTAFNIAALAAGAALTAPAYGHTSVFFMYPFTVVSSVGISLAYRRLDQVLALTASLVGAYIVAAVGLHHDQVWNVLPNAGTYVANATVAWAVAHHVRHSGVRLDAMSAQATKKAAVLATQQERLRHARILHDRVLQTLETLARGEWISNPGFRAHVASEAAWLRGLVEGGLTPYAADDLSTGLQRLIRDKALLGLQVEFNSSQLHHLGEARDFADPKAMHALIDAAGEALTNVAKHSGVSSALMRVSVTSDRLAVSVLDHGRGFDVTAAPRGVGLRESVQGRLHEVGGAAYIESNPGMGTFVELSVPRPSGPPPQPGRQAGTDVTRSEAVDVDEVVRPRDPEGAVPVRGVVHP